MQNPWSPPALTPERSAFNRAPFRVPALAPTLTERLRGVQLAPASGVSFFPGAGALAGLDTGAARSGELDGARAKLQSLMNERLSGLGPAEYNARLNSGAQAISSARNAAIERLRGELGARGLAQSGVFFAGAAGLESEAGARLAGLRGELDAEDARLRREQWRDATEFGLRALGLEAGLAQDAADRRFRSREGQLNRDLERGLASDRLRDNDRQREFAREEAARDRALQSQLGTASDPWEAERRRIEDDHARGEITAEERDRLLARLRAARENKVLGEDPEAAAQKTREDQLVNDLVSTGLYTPSEARRVIEFLGYDSAVELLARLK
ncbi:MAG: hypothetical protein GMKNLPBB_00817 [Myxococcota bacterium]|nr:hypothetical protein [Myxococcota bacterium]